MTLNEDSLFAPPILPEITYNPDAPNGFDWPIPENANMAELCCDRWSRVQPERVALTHVNEDGQSRDWCYRELHQASCNLAAYLSQQGIASGDRVALLLGQSPEALITHFACYRIGAIALPLFTLFGVDALQFRLADSGAKLLITDTSQTSKIAALEGQLPELAHVLICGSESDSDSTLPSITTARFEAAIKEPVNPEDWPAIAPPDAPAMMIYTSGTTGAPKGALHAHRFLLGHLPNVEISHNGLGQESDKGWTPADWAWIGGLMDLAMPCLYYGVPLVAMRFVKFDANEAFDFIAKHQIRNMFLPPTALKLMRFAEAEHGLPEGVSIRSIASGGEALPEAVVSWAKQQLGVDINEIYGQTECNLVICSQRPHTLLPEGAMGAAVHGHQVAILDADNKPCPPGNLGEIAVKTPDPVMMLGYWGQPEKTAEKISGGWLRTGDMGCMDKDGIFTFVARDDDVITSAGYRVGPSEIENCLMQHPRVQLAAVIGLPDPIRTEIITACIVPDQHESLEELEEDLKKLVKNRLSPHLMPRRFVWQQTLPLTATGKIMRRKLRGAFI
jgi:acetyl-CoA synthetase